MPEEIKKYVGPFSGPQIDQIFYEILNYTSERYAKGTANGVPVDPGTAGYEDNSLFYKNQAAAQAAQAQQAVTNANVQAARAETAAAAAETSETNASAAAVTAAAEADRAEDAADRAEAIVGGNFVSYDPQPGKSEAEKAQARENIGAEISEVKTATPGAVVTFDDAATAPLDELEVELAIDQDLNGYAYPWPAGGGKNICPYENGTQTSNGVTFTPQSDGSIKISGTASSTATYYFYSNTNILNLAAGESYRMIVTTNGGEGASGLSIVAEATSGTLGNGTDITVTIPAADTNSAARLRVQRNTVIDVIAYPLIMPASQTDTTWVPYSNVCPITPHTAANITVNSNLYTVQLGGEYYAGELDVKTGRLTVKYGMVDMGSINWTWRADVSSTGVFAADLTDYKGAADVRAYCSAYKFAGTVVSVASVTEDKAVVLYYQSSNPSGRKLYVRDSKYDGNAAAFKTSVSGVQLVYELATPLVIQLDPATIYTEEGSNTVQADTGDILVLSYRTKGSVQVEDFAALLAEETAGAGTSNRNLLDNGSFLINQRGVSGTLANGYGLDRWIVFASGGSVSYDATAKTVTLTATSNVAYLQQKVEDDLRAAIDGKTVTFSVLTTDGIVYKNTFTYDASAHDSGPYFPDNPKLRFWYGGDFALCLRVEAAYAITIKRIKLEIGDKSTIANEVPDKAEELATSRGDFQRLMFPALYGTFGVGRALSATDFRCFIPLPVPLRAAPTLSTNGLDQLRVVGQAGSQPITACNYVGYTENGINVSFITSGLSPGHVYVITRGSTGAGGYIDISAEP